MTAAAAKLYDKDDGEEVNVVEEADDEDAADNAKGGKEGAHAPVKAGSS